MKNKGIITKIVKGKVWHKATIKPLGTWKFWKRYHTYIAKYVPINTELYYIKCHNQIIAIWVKEQNNLYRIPTNEGNKNGDIKERISKK